MSNEAITWAFKQQLPTTQKFVLVALAELVGASKRTLCMSCNSSKGTRAEPSRPRCDERRDRVGD